MITRISSWGIFHELQKNLDSPIVLLIVASEEYVNVFGKLNADGMEPEELVSKEMESAQRLFVEIRNSNYKEKYTVLFVEDKEMEVIILATTEEAVKNIRDYVQNTLGLSLRN